MFNHNIVSIITENTNDFISFVKDNFKKNFSSLIDLLLKNPVMPQEKNKILEQCNTILYEQIDINGDYIDTMIKLWSECLIASNDTDIGEHYVQSFISDELIRSRFISENQKNKWKMDFVIYIAEQECFLTILLPWMINYLKRTKSSTIDLNRYKLESFLINTSITQIDEAMCNALREKDFHIREHLSDIIGEKHLSIAYSSLCAAIVNEPSLYAGKSIIVALGKIGLGKEQDAAEKIIDWLYDNLNRIIASGQDFTNSILTKSKNSILKLYPIYEDKFDLLFNEYITNKNY